MAKLTEEQYWKEMEKVSARITEAQRSLSKAFDKMVKDTQPSKKETLLIEADSDSNIVTVEVLDSNNKESKNENIIDAEIVEEEVKEEDKVDLNDFNIEDDKVTMQNRTVKPVIKIKTNKEPKVKIKVNHEHHDHKVDDEEHHQLIHTIEHLNNYLP